MSEPAAVFFQAGNSAYLRTLGLVGQHVWGTLTDGTLDLRGDESGSLRIAPADIVRMRVGYTDGSKRRDYETRIWLAQGKQALRLTPYPHTWSAYTLTLRAFAALMAGQGRIANIEGGYSKFDALFAPVLTGLVALGAIGVSLFALGNSPWWARLIVPAVPLAVFGMLLYVGMARSWPRPLTDLAELEGQLPPVASEPATLQDRLWVLIGGRRRK